MNSSTFFRSPDVPGFCPGWTTVSTTVTLAVAIVSKSANFLVCQCKCNMKPVLMFSPSKDLSVKNKRMCVYCLYSVYTADFKGGRKLKKELNEEIYISFEIMLIFMKQVYSTT